MKDSKEITALLSKFVKEMVKDALQSLIKEERMRMGKRRSWAFG